MDPEQEIKTILDETTEELVQAEPFPTEWGPWMVHILQYLDRTARRGGDQADFDAMLIGLQEKIGARVKSGKWPEK